MQSFCIVNCLGRGEKFFATTIECYDTFNYCKSLIDKKKRSQMTPLFLSTFNPNYFSFSITACAAASLAIGTLNGEQET